MKSTEGRIGRVFIIQLENDDIVPHCIETFAAANRIEAASVLFIGGIYDGEIVVGPRKTHANPPDPMTIPVDGAHEAAAMGLIAPDADGKPVLHIHGALGRSGATKTGCLRKGVATWLTGEVVIYEILGTTAKRLTDPKTGFKLLSV